MVRPYEAVVVLDPMLDEESTEAQVTRLQKLIADQGGTVVSIERWGRRRLAYELRGHHDGNYILVTFDAEPSAAKELERVLRLTDAVLRHLVVRRVVRSPQPAAVQEG